MLEPEGLRDGFAAGGNGPCCGATRPSRATWRRTRDRVEAIASSWRRAQVGMESAGPTPGQRTHTPTWPRSGSWPARARAPRPAPKASRPFTL